MYFPSVGVISRPYLSWQFNTLLFYVVNFVVKVLRFSGPSLLGLFGLSFSDCSFEEFRIWDQGEQNSKEIAGSNRAGTVQSCADTVYVITFGSGK
jgi:hypothetical protein